MDDAPIPVDVAAVGAEPSHETVLALIGHPNAGKTTLFNALCGLRARTANFPGSTIEARLGTWTARGTTMNIVDLPGVYRLGLDRPESRVCGEYLEGDMRGFAPPDVIAIVADACNLSRHLVLACQALQHGRPCVLIVNKLDAAAKRGIHVDLDALRDRLDVPVIGVSARRRAGLDELADAVRTARHASLPLPAHDSADDATTWAREIAAACVRTTPADEIGTTMTDRIDALVTHPLIGPAIFAGVMIALFYVIYSVAAWPMDLIELTFEQLGGLAASVLPDGAIRDMVVDGVIAGVAGTVVFVPQIALLFFLISLLENTGYLARAASMLDRPLRHVGLSGYSFVPLLSAHACAIPAIMSCRMIPDHRDRMATILIAPLMSCSARLPVYVLLVGLLFGDEPLLAAFAFAGCYLLGAVMGASLAIIIRATLVRGSARHMLIELPDYTMPSPRTAFLTTVDRTVVFLKKAGTVILAICVVLWWLSAYPKSDPPAEATALRTTAAQVEMVSADEAAAMLDEAEALEARHASAQSFIGRIGRTAEPVFAPLGYDWQITIGVMSSFLAREVFVSTMAVIVSGDDSIAEEETSLRQTMANATRSDGSPLLTQATCVSLLVFYVLALQCLPTVAVTRRELNSWGWAFAQLATMSVLAWVMAALAYRLALLGGLG